MSAYSLISPPLSKEKKGTKTISSCPTHVNMTNTEVTKSKRMLEQRAPPSG